MRKASIFILSMALVLSFVSGVFAQDEETMMGRNIVISFNTTDFAADAGLADVTGEVHVLIDDAYLHITLEPNGAELPEGTVLEGWLVDAGLDGGPGMTNASDADETYGTPFGNADFDTAVEAAPYAFSTGVLTETDEGTWEEKFEVPGYNFSPYDAIVITLESDGNSEMGFDPRPGAPIFIAGFADGMEHMDDESMMDESMSDESMSDESMGESMGDESMGDESMMDDDMMMDMMSAVEVPLEVTDLAEGAGLADITATAYVSSAEGAVEIVINLNGAELPEGTVLEGWLVDAGLEGGPGMTNVSDADEVYGIPFGNADFDALVESAPYALSTGVAAGGEMGELSLTFHIPAYNFSPYDAVVVTLESDGDGEGFDPRPGAPVLAGAIADDMMQ